MKTNDDLFNKLDEILASLQGIDDLLDESGKENPDDGSGGSSKKRGKKKFNWGEAIWNTAYNTIVETIGVVKEFEQQSYDAGRAMGLYGEQLNKYHIHALKGIQTVAAKVKITEKEYYALQNSIAQATNKSMILNEEQMTLMGGMTKFVDQADIATMVGSMDKFGASTNTAMVRLAKGRNEALKWGLNAKETTGLIAKNIHLASSYTFKGGTAELAKMVAHSQHLKYNMENVLRGAENFYELDKGIQTAAQLQVLGGNIGREFSDVLSVMYDATSDSASFLGRIERSVEGMGTWNAKTGEAEIDPINRAKIRYMSQASGIGVDEIMNIAQSKVKNEQISNAVAGKGFNEDQLKWLQSQAQYDTDTGKWQVNTYDHTTGKYVAKNLDDITTENIDAIQKDIIGEDKMPEDVRGILRYVENIAKASSTNQEKEDSAMTQIKSKLAEVAEPVRKGMHWLWDTLGPMVHLMLGALGLGALKNILGGAGKMLWKGLGKGIARLVKGKGKAGVTKPGISKGSTTTKAKGSSNTSKAKSKGSSKAKSKGSSKAKRKGSSKAKSKGRSNFSKVKGRNKLKFNNQAKTVAKGGTKTVTKTTTQATSKLANRANQFKAFTKSGGKNITKTLGKGLIKGGGVGGAVALGGTLLNMGGQALGLWNEGSTTDKVMTSVTNIASAASTGAMIGSVIPGIGNVVGGAVGAVVGTAMEVWNAVKGEKERNKEELAKLEWETTKMQDQVVNGDLTREQLEEASWMATVKIHDLLISWFNEKVLDRNTDGSEKGWWQQVTEKGLIDGTLASLGFADGGIVGGDSYEGDNVHARVNSGEMILNRKQQSNLFAMANGNVNAGAQLNTSIVAKPVVGTPQHIAPSVPTPSVSQVPQSTSVNVNVSGTLRIESNGQSGTLDMNQLLNNPQFKQEVINIVQRGLNERTQGGGRPNKDTTYSKLGGANSQTTARGV